MGKWYGVWRNGNKTGYAGVIDVSFKPQSYWYDKRSLAWCDTEKEARGYKQYLDSMISDNKD